MELRLKLVVIHPTENQIQNEYNQSLNPNLVCELSQVDEPNDKYLVIFSSEETARTWSYIFDAIIINQTNTLHRPSRESSTIGALVDLELFKKDRLPLIKQNIDKIVALTKNLDEVKRRVESKMFNLDPDSLEQELSLLVYDPGKKRMERVQSFMFHFKKPQTNPKMKRSYTDYHKFLITEELSLKEHDFRAAKIARMRCDQPESMDPFKVSFCNNKKIFES